MEFGTFLGNERLKERLAAAFSKNAVSHAFLLTGPKGSGKHTLAKLLCAVMECTSPEKPCLRCAACRKVMSDVHPDVITVDDPDRATVSVATIRSASADAVIRPNEGARKIYLIPRADDMQARTQNALLKIIEEPPPYAAFILLSENSASLLTTVRSRCVELSLSPLRWEQAAGFLREKVPGKNDAELRSALDQAGGWLGTALEILSENGGAQSASAFAEAYASGDRLQLLRFFTSMEKRKRTELEPEIQAWRAMVIEALKVRSGVGGSASERKIAQYRTPQELSAAADDLSTALEYLALNGNVAGICAFLSVRLFTHKS